MKFLLFPFLTTFYSHATIKKVAKYIPRYHGFFLQLMNTTHSWMIVKSKPSAHLCEHWRNGHAAVAQFFSQVKQLVSSEYHGQRHPAHPRLYETYTYMKAN